jgi:hypothetical protein
MRIVNISTSFARAVDDAAVGSVALYFVFIEETMVRGKPELGAKTVLTVCLILLWENVVMHSWVRSFGQIN